MMGNNLKLSYKIKTEFFGVASRCIKLQQGIDRDSKKGLIGSPKGVDWESQKGLIGSPKRG